MNFLELCQRVRQESGISGTGPESVLNQKAILQKVVEWVRQADLDIQRLHGDWFFLWRMGTANLTAGVASYSGQSLGLTGSLQDLLVLEINGYPLRRYSWKQYKAARYQITGLPGTPSCYTVRPDNMILVSPAPRENMAATAEYSIEIQPMVDDGDFSLIPEKFHDVILQKALMYYASNEEDNSLYQVASMRYENALSELANDQLPTVDFVGGIR